MHDHGIDPDRFEENDLARDPMTFRRIGRIHEAAAVFKDEELAAKSLNVRQRFEQRSGFRDDFLHELSRARQVDRALRRSMANVTRLRRHPETSRDGARDPPKEFHVHPPSDVGSLRLPLLNSTYSSVRSLV